MSSTNPNDMQQAFEEAKNRLRTTGAGGVLESSDKHGNQESKNIDSEISNSKRNLSFKNGVVTIGSGKIKIIQHSNGIRIFSFKKNPQQSKGE